MSVPQLTYTVSHYVQNPTTGVATLETFEGIPTTNLKFSYQSPYNTLSVTYTPDISLAYYEVRATKVGESYGIGVGTRLYYKYPNIASNSNESFTITFTSENLPDDGAYLLGFYAKSDAADGLWDVTYLLISSDNYIIAPSDYDGIEVLTDEPIPSA